MTLKKVKYINKIKLSNKIIQFCLCLLLFVFFTLVIDNLCEVVVLILYNFYYVAALMDVFLTETSEMENEKLNSSVG